MNSSDLFAFAISGAQTENSMNQYQGMLKSNQQDTSNLNGWLADKVGSLRSGFTSFMNSRLWEYSARLLGEGNGEHVGRFDIGYLGSLNGLQGAEGLMQNYIMANPNVMKLYQDDLISGYGGEFSPLCSGIGKDNYFYRQAMNGVEYRDEQDSTVTWKRSHYDDTIGEKLSYRDRVNIHKTWSASNHHLATSFLDITSSVGDYRKDHETVTEEV